MNRGQIRPHPFILIFLVLDIDGVLCLQKFADNIWREILGEETWDSKPVSNPEMWKPGHELLSTWAFSPFVRTEPRVGVSVCLVS